MSLAMTLAVNVFRGVRAQHRHETSSDRPLPLSGGVNGVDAALHRHAQHVQRPIALFDSVGDTSRQRLNPGVTLASVDPNAKKAGEGHDVFLLTIVVYTTILHRDMAGIIARELKQQSKFASREQEVLLGLRIAAARIMEPWEKFLKGTAELTPNQYNVLRILRGSHPTRLSCGDIADRMIARDPDITRLVDRLSRGGLVTRVRGRRDRRVVEVGIT